MLQRFDDDWKRADFVKRVFDYVEKVHGDMSFIMSKEVTGRGSSPFSIC